MLTIYAVQFKDGDIMYFKNKSDAMDELWNYYLSNYFEDESEDERAVTEDEFYTWSSIEDVGYVYGIEVK